MLLFIYRAALPGASHPSCYSFIQRLYASARNVAGVVCARCRCSRRTPLCDWRDTHLPPLPRRRLACQVARNAFSRRAAVPHFLGPTTRHHVAVALTCCVVQRVGWLIAAWACSASRTAGEPSLTRDLPAWYTFVRLRRILAPAGPCGLLPADTLTNVLAASYLCLW